MRPLGLPGEEGSCILANSCPYADPPRGEGERKGGGAGGGSRRPNAVARILVYAADADQYLGLLREAAPHFEIAAASTPEQAAAHLDADILFAWGIPPELVARMPNLCWVQWLGAGVDRVVGALPPHVPLTRVVGAFGGVMTEHVFAFLLAIRHDIFRMRSLQAERRWEKVPAQQLRGQRLGVAGLGAIGREIVGVGRAFGMEVWGLSRSGQHGDIVDRHFRTDELIDFAAGVDNLVLVLPATPDTDGLFGAQAFAAMREGAVLVNVGRGNAVDEEALAAALRAGRPAFAQLDVFRSEPLPPESPLWGLPNCFISAHCSGPSEARRVGEFAAANLRRYAAGEPLAGIVERARGY